MTVLALHLDSCVIRKTVCVCVCVCQVVRVCVHVILHNPAPSVMTVITSPSLHISDSAHIHTNTQASGSRMPKLSRRSSTLITGITLHYFSRASLHAVWCHRPSHGNANRREKSCNTNEAEICKRLRKSTYSCCKLYVEKNVWVAFFFLPDDVWTCC